MKKETSLSEALILNAILNSFWKEEIISILYFQTFLILKCSKFTRLKQHGLKYHMFSQKRNFL